MVLKAWQNALVSKTGRTLCFLQCYAMLIDKYTYNLLNSPKIGCRIMGVNMMLSPLPLLYLKFDLKSSGMLERWLGGSRFGPKLEPEPFLWGNQSPLEATSFNLIQKISQWNCPCQVRHNPVSSVIDCNTYIFIQKLFTFSPEVLVLITMALILWTKILQQTSLCLPCQLLTVSFHQL